MSNEDVSLTVRLRGEAEFGGETKKIEVDIRRIREEADKSQKSFKGLGSELGLAGGMMKLLLPSTLIVGIGFLTEGISALTSGVVALVAALSPLIGMAAEYPSLFLAAGQAMGVFKLATSGVLAAIGGLNSSLDPKKLAGLTVTAQQFAVTMQRLKQPVRELQLVAQSALFGGMTQGLRAAASVLKPLQPVVKATAGALGGLVDRAGQLVKAWSGQLVGLGQNNVLVIHNLGTAALELAGALKNILVAAEPLTLWLSRSIAVFAAHLRAVTGTSKGMRELRGFFELTRKTMMLVLGIAAPLGTALVNIFKAALPSGQSLLTMLGNASKAFAAWTGSKSGQKTIGDWFKNGMPVMVQMAGLVKDLVVDFFKLGQGKGFQQLITAVRKDLLPALVKLVKGTTDGFGPVLIKALTQVVTLFATLGGANGPLTVFVKGLGTAAGWVNTLFKKFPGLKPVISDALGGLALFEVGSKGVTGLVGGVGSAIGAMKKLGKAILGLQLTKDFVAGFSNAQAAESAFTGFAGTIGGKLKTAATAVKTFTTNMLGLDAAEDANPIGLIVLGIVALTATIAASIHWYKQITDLNWKLKVAIAVLGGPIAWLVLGVAELTKAWHNQGKIADWIRGKFDSLIGWFKGAGSSVAKATKGLWTGLKDSFVGVLNWIIKQWDSLHFKIPKVHVPGLGTLGGQEISLGHISPIAMATGGTITPSSGSWVSGEAGPELNTFSGGGVRVQPLTKSGANPKGMGAFADTLKHVFREAASSMLLESHHEFTVDGLTLAKAIDRQVATARARG